MFLIRNVAQLFYHKKTYALLYFLVALQRAHGLDFLQEGLHKGLKPLGFEVGVAHFFTDDVSEELVVTGGLELDVVEGCGHCYCLLVINWLS